MGISGIAAMGLENGDSLENSIRDVAARNVTYLRRENSIEGEIAATTISNLIRRVSGSSVAEIDSLVCELAAMREHLEDERDRVQNAIIEFARLSQSSVASTNSITEALEQMKKAANLHCRS
jgi:hypothetical protein